MDVDRTILCVATILLLAAVWIAFPVSDYHQRAAVITKDIADLKLLLNEERDRRVALETHVNNLQKKTIEIQNEMVKKLLEVNGQMQEFTNRQDVAFYARLAKSYDNIAAWATIVFTDVETNSGNAYNSADGEFTAPIAGNYVFFSHILSAFDRVVETSLQVNGNNKMYLYSGGKYHGSGSNMAVIHLNAGDKVKMVKHGPWGTMPFYIHPSWSSFSGFLLRADATALVPALTI